MHEKIMLWSTLAPYTAESPDQAQPSITDYSVKGSKGAVVVVPGGGYAMKADHEGAPIAEMLNEAGISAYVLDYRVHPCHKLAPLSDAKRAIRVVRSMGYEKVAILGFSAGGHLTCTAAPMYDAGDPASDAPIERLSSRPDQFIPCYAVASFIQYTHGGTVQNLLGDERYSIAELKKFSNELRVTPETPEAFIWHTAADQAVPVENSLNLAAAMSKNGVPYELHIFPYGQHGLGLAADFEDVRQWSGLVQKFLVLRGYN